MSLVQEMFGELILFVELVLNSYVCQCLGIVHILNCFEQFSNLLRNKIEKFHGLRILLDNRVKDYFDAEHFLFYLSQ